ncbi:MAG: nuclear transport factor 2 family protein [Dehalococcoidia bacterium]
MLDGFYEALSSGSPDRVEAYYSVQPGVAFIGSDEGESWVDTSRRNSDVRRLLDGSLGRIRWTPGNPICLMERSVGWTIDHPTIEVERSPPFELRLTVIWHLEKGVWRVVHSHASFGAGDTMTG